jgi:hypothetical protein
VRRPTVIAIACATALAGCGGAGHDTGTSSAPGPGTSATGTGTRTSTPTGAAAPAKPGLVVGIGDQGAAMFAAPLFRALHVDHARLVVAYDAVAVGFERQLTDQWLRAARAAGVEPFVTFGHSRVHPRRLPSVAAFTRAFKAFRARYPQVRVYAAWNEINHVSQPTADDPVRAAAYYNVVRANCPGCTVVAGDLLDQAGAERYLRRYVPRLHGAPRLWGLHNYSDTNRFRDKGTRAFLDAVKGDVWLTETGGVARVGRAFPFDLRRQARATAFMLRLARRHPRITRVYVYNWTGAAPDARFDAGLTNADGSPRPAYDAFRRALAR